MMKRFRHVFSVFIVLGLMAPILAWMPQPQIAAAAAVDAPLHKLQGAGWLELTMRGCPDGVMPQNVDPAVSCTTPLDAPDISTVSWGETSISVPPIARNFNGTYQFDVPGDTELRLSGFEPVLRDAFLAVGADHLDSAGNPIVTVPSGGSRHITFYYYNYSGDSAPPQNGTIPLADVMITTSILGWPYTGGCFELVEQGETLCSEFLADMTYGVVFTNVAAGTYTVRQTEDLGDVYIRDFTITVAGEDVTEHVEVIPSWGSPSRNSESSLFGFDQRYGIEEIVVDTNDPEFWNKNVSNVSVVFIDTTTQTKVISSACVQIVGQSNVSCDSQRGQIDILDVPIGDHELKITQLPDGYELAPGMENLRISPPGRNPHVPSQIVYVIDVVPAGTGSAPAATASSPEPAAQDAVDEALLTICASNRHGVDYPAFIFNLPLSVAVEMGFVILDDDGNPHPEWSGVRFEPCDHTSGFHLWEFVESPQSTVEYCYNGETLTSPAENLGLEFVDPSIQGQALHGGYQFANWGMAPEGMIPGTCQEPVGYDGNVIFQGMVGEWVGVDRSVVINEDGSGVVIYTNPDTGDVMTFYIKVDIGSYPVMATVTSLTFTGNPDLAMYPRVGDSIKITLAPASFLYVELIPPNSVGYCLSMDQPYAQGNCD